MNIEQLKQLNELKNSGVISQEEFEQTKAKILSGEMNSSNNVAATTGTGPQTIIYNTNAQTNPAENMQEPLKSRSAYIILAVLFGTLGIHNFYAGHNSKGIAQLLIALLLGWLVIPIFIIWIWVLIEIFTVKKDGANRLMTPAGSGAWVVFAIFVLLPLAFVFYSFSHALHEYILDEDTSNTSVAAEFEDPFSDPTEDPFAN